MSIRDEFLEIVKRDLLGPAGNENEIVEEQAVRGRYVLGLLAPRGQSALPEEDEALDSTEGDGGEVSADTRPPKAATMLPSSIGLTFTVDAGAEAIQIIVRWGFYERKAREDLGLPDKKFQTTAWQRKQIEGMSSPIALKRSTRKQWRPSADFSDVYVDYLIRKQNGKWVITVFLVNSQHENRQKPDESWVFQPELVIQSPDGAAIFSARQMHDDLLTQQMDDEERILKMAYRRRVEFAVGHGVAVHAEVSPERYDCAVRLSTSVVPTFEIAPTQAPSIDEIAELSGLMLDMKQLADLSDAQLVDGLQPLVGAYQTWIDLQRQRLNDADLAEHRESATLALSKCQQALERIQAGIRVLGSSPDAAKAFRFANKAMWLQRVQSEFAAANRKGEKVSLKALDIPKNRSWRPFQLAFVLLNLPALVDPTHPDRAESPEALADVLWFPTGGGKTEAYLGLTALVLGIRRLQGELGGPDASAGVAVLMRYTLRTLTLQQFQRASALICACELLRQQNDKVWGTEPFRIGLWVGSASTPNRTRDSAQAIRNLHGFYGGGKGTPHQLENCPWCGHRIDPKKNNIEVDEYPGHARTYIYCGDETGTCEFCKKKSPEGLPVVVVDEEVYRTLPALVIATADKFARLPWQGESQMLFGRVTGYCPRHGWRSKDLEDVDNHPRDTRRNLPPVRTDRSRNGLRPPDLIIQDELHLINGPLGSMVGLYETVVDKLCSWSLNGKVVRPKVIASSATIRKSAAQVNHLYLRQATVFPPTGIDVEDNFFSRQRKPTSELHGRLYVGICAPGTRIKSVLIRLYTVCLSAAQQLVNKHHSPEVDPYMTLVGYFNSMRELGGMRRATDDAVRTRLLRMDERGLARRSIGMPREMTSRIPAAEIPRLLAALDLPFATEVAERDALQPTAATEASANKEKPIEAYKLRPVDVLLATNMISVGVDVPRLGLMVVGGQPKNTAEYIQATSRIGRKYPGIVFTAYNWARPRDLSHYERFEHYHHTFYQQVEALSVTPFAPRALDRGLSALFTAYVRLMEDRFNGNKDAAAINAPHQLVDQAITDISTRAATITARPDIGQHVRDLLQHKASTWIEKSIHAQRTGADLDYFTYKKEERNVHLLQPAGENPWGEFTCLNSLRDVETPVNLILNDYDMSDLTIFSGQPDAETPIIVEADSDAEDDTELDLD